LANWFYWQDKMLFLHIQLQPRASTNRIVGIHGEHLKIRITTPPLDGRANKHLIQFLATSFKVAQHRVCIVKGELSRIKLIRIDTPNEMNAIAEWMTESK
jgi:uncharacterized protein (TIGR00251 family)